MSDEKATNKLDNILGSESTQKQTTTKTTTPQAEPKTQAQRLVTDIMSKARSIDLDDITRDDAVKIASEITTKLRMLGSEAHTAMTSDDFELLARLMSRLLGKGRE